eukprot:652806-Prymnesium_polylepis.1
MSIVLFDFQPTAQFFAGAFLVIASAYIYGVGPDKVAQCCGKASREPPPSFELKEALSEAEDESAPLRREGKGAQGA